MLFRSKPEWPEVSKVLPLIEAALEPFQPRPHWGKLFTMSHALLPSRYAKLAEFKTLVGGYDPEGKFRNEFVSTNLYGS